MRRLVLPLDTTVARKRLEREEEPSAFLTPPEEFRTIPSPSTVRTGQPERTSAGTWRRRSPAGASGQRTHHCSRERKAEQPAAAGSTLIPSVLRYHSADLLTLLLSAVTH